MLLPSKWWLCRVTYVAFFSFWIELVSCIFLLLILSVQSGPQLVPVCLCSVAADLQREHNRKYALKGKAVRGKKINTANPPLFPPSLLPISWSFVIGIPEVY